MKKHLRAAVLQLGRLPNYLFWPIALTAILLIAPWLTMLSPCIIKLVVAYTSYVFSLFGGLAK